VIALVPPLADGGKEVIVLALKPHEDAVPDLGVSSLPSVGMPQGEYHIPGLSFTEGPGSESDSSMKTAQSQNWPGP
jgi:hypothetical protein